MFSLLINIKDKLITSFSTHPSYILSPYLLYLPNNQEVTLSRNISGILIDSKKVNPKSYSLRT